MSLYDGGQCLPARLGPATPDQLAGKIREFADYLLDIGAHVTAGVLNGEPAQANRLTDADATNNTIIALCK